MSEARLDPIWRGQTVVCIATGPSLTPEQVALVERWRAAGGCRAIAINDAYLYAPWADALYFADVRWWQWQDEGRMRLGPLKMTSFEVQQRFREFAGMRISIENAGQRVPDPRVIVLKNFSIPDGSPARPGGTMGRLSQDPTGIFAGQNSGYQAIGCAVLLGSKRIVLLGYDMKAKTLPGGELLHHCWGNHPVPSDQGAYRQWRDEYARMAVTARLNGIEIVNATADSDLDCFPMVRLESLVADTSAAALSA